MQTADVSALLPPEKRALFDGLVRDAEAEWAERIRRQAASCMARRAPEPIEPRVPRRPVGDRMRVG